MQPSALSVACSLRILPLWEYVQLVTVTMSQQQGIKVTADNMNVTGSGVTRKQQGILLMGSNERVTVMGHPVIGTW